MAGAGDQGADERTQLLGHPRRRNHRDSHDRRLNSVTEAAETIISSHLNKDEQALAENAVGERLTYNEYTTIDWLHDLVKDSYRYRALHANKSIRCRLVAAFDACQGWIAAALIGALTACVAAFVDMAVATVSDWKSGYCSRNILATRKSCCTKNSPLLSPLVETAEDCAHWHDWSSGYWESFGIYVGWALLFGLISAGVTRTTKKSLPATAPGYGDDAMIDPTGDGNKQNTGKTMYMAAGSGIPEIKTILSGFAIPHFLDLKVLVVKAIGSIFAVPTGMNLGKEGPFVHISTCMASLVANLFPKYRNNGRKFREMLAAGCASGLSVAFGAPVGGVLFAYEEISTYFPRKVLWRAFICSLSAAIFLRALNPFGTGRLVLFETGYGQTYQAEHYFVFVILGIAGGIWGGIFCKANFLWSRTFRKISVIKQYPAFETFLIVLATTLLQFPNPLTREPGDIVIKNLLIDCNTASEKSFICSHESAANTEGGSVSTGYLGYLIYGSLVKLLLTIITFGVKVPSGVIIPALDGGGFFGRLVGQLPFLSASISPGIFAMVGAVAFLAGVSRMTISLAVIMFELTGELELIVPNMIGIMVAKWVADLIEQEGVYELAQTVLGHPFLDQDHSAKLVRKNEFVVADLTPPKQTMDQITVEVPPSGCVEKLLLMTKLRQLKGRGLMDAGLVLVHATRNNILAGYIAEGELDFGLNTLGAHYPSSSQVRIVAPSSSAAEHQDNNDEEANGETLGQQPDQQYLDLTSFVDRTPLTIVHTAPMEYAVEMFGKLGLKYLIITEEGTGRVTGVIIKKRLVLWLEGLKRSHG